MIRTTLKVADAVVYDETGDTSMKIRTTLKVADAVVYDETTSLEEARAAMDAAVASVPEDAKGALLLESEATFSVSSAVTLDAEQVRKNRHLEKALRDSPARIEAELKRLARKVGA